MPKSAPKKPAKVILKDFPSSLSSDQKTEVLEKLQSRFEEHPEKHGKLSWGDVEKKLTDSKLTAVYAMELTEGEPEIVELDGKPLVVDYSPESPSGRRSVCYDQEALDKRKTAKPQHSAVAMAKDMGVKLLDEEQYKALQELAPFDLKTSSWVETPAAMREKGGALFGDNRYGQMFFYHNGAESYYAARGFRTYLEL